MSIQKFTALAFVSVLLAGCGGGANIEFEDQLKADLAESQAEVTRLTQELTDALETARQATEDATEASRAATAAEMRATAAEQRATDAEAARDADVARYRQEAEDARAAVTAAEQRATAAQAQADAARQQVQEAQQQQQQAQQEAEEARQQTSSLEASQRAKNLLTVFPEIGDSAAAPTGDSPVIMTVPSRGSLTFAQGGRSVAALSSPLLSGERGARLTRTRGGTDTTVVYTDRELSRLLLDHYAAAKPSADAKELVPGTTPAPAATGNLFTDANWKVSHGFAGAVAEAAAGDDRAPTKERASFGGSLHGIPGQFLCENTGATDCMITLTSAYNDTLANGTAAADANKLNSVTMTVSNGGLRFKPSSASASVSLGPTGIQGVVGDDGEYMTFGWWGHEPAHINGTYTFGVFSDVVGTGVASTFTGTAEYDGTAVGLYVDQDATTARQGEYTAAVRLTASFASGAATISGEIDNFQTTPRGGSGEPTLSDSWVVELNSTSGGTDGTARIRRTGSTSTGAWSHALVPLHAGARAAEDPPPAVTGTFNTQIENLLQIVGAYGAELQQQ